jgi:hypothetical protein
LVGGIGNECMIVGHELRVYIVRVQCSVCVQCVTVSNACMRWWWVGRYGWVWVGMGVSVDT